MNFIRRARAMTSIALVWGIIWAGLSVPLCYAILNGLSFAERLDVSQWLAGRIGLGGIASGIAFSVLLAVRERRTQFPNLSFGRTLVWGALAGTACCLAALLRSPSGRAQELELGAPSLAVAAILGGVTAVSTLLIARRSHDVHVHVSEGTRVGRATSGMR